MSNNTSTVSFRSNLYPVKGNFFYDKIFHSQIHDPFSLESFNKTMVAKKIAQFTSLQEQEYRVAAKHCIYAEPDDYPWGTIKNGDEPEKVVCKCLNIKCHNFKRCRPDFKPEELSVLEENKTAQVVILKFENSQANEQISPDGDSDAATQVFGKVKPENKSVEKKDAPPLAQETSAKKNPPVVPEPSKPISKPIEVKKVSFESFSETTQENIIEAAPEERIVINAAPGTGKTWTLIEKIIRMINEKKVAAEEILVLCFSRAATETIKNRLAEAVEVGRVGYEWQDVDVRTFDSFSTYMLAWLQDNKSELLPQPFSLLQNDYEQRIRIAASVFEKTKDMLGSYRHIIVDEVQDLVGNRAELVLAMLKSLPVTCGFTILGDSCQALYDYLAADNPSLMTSEQFYKNIFRNFAAANYYSLNENYRQNDEIKKLSTSCREAIISASWQKCHSAASNLLAKIPELPAKLHEFSNADAEKYSGTLGILTRTNAQALQISAWLHNNDVPHFLNRGRETSTYGGWIAKIFCDCQNATIDEKEFVTLYRTNFPTATDEIATDHWNALVATQRASKQRYEISDLLKGLFKNSGNSLLYEAVGNENCAITVSNIHRSKGKEFDSVIVLDDVIENMTNPDDENIFEHKVCYVALTRPRKKIERVKIFAGDKQIFITKNADGSSRCSKATLQRSSQKGKLNISHFEVGKDGDWDFESFASDKNIQQYIQKNISAGMRLMLIKCPENTKSYVVYRIVEEDDEDLVLGYTSESFARELEKAIQHIKNITCPVFFKMYPSTFCDLYVCDTATYISTKAPVPDGAKTFGEVSIWAGIKIIGFAAVYQDIY